MYYNPGEELPLGATIAPNANANATKPAGVTAVNKSDTSPELLVGWLSSPSPGDEALSSAVEDARAGLQMLSFTKKYLDSTVGEFVVQ